MVKLELDIPDEFYKEEVRCGYTVTTEMKKIWAVELDLLNKFMEVCNANGIKYVMIGGTLLGAVRHGGFIPWDDDVDVMVDAENYQKLCALPKDAFQYPYFFQTEQTDPGSLRGHAQLRNSETTGMLSSEQGKVGKINQGIFIDIFPFYNVPDDENECDMYLEHMRKLKKYAELLSLFTTRSTYKPRSYLKRFIQIIFSCFLKPILGNSNWFYRKLEIDALRYSNTKTKCFGCITFCIDRRSILNRFDSENVVDFSFEMLKVPVPAGYDALLTSVYGDWHKFVVGTSLHGGVLFDTEKSYKAYVW